MVIICFGIYYTNGLFLLFVDLSDGMTRTTSPYLESIINVALYKGGVQCSQGRFGKNLFYS